MTVQRILDSLQNLENSHIAPDANIRDALSLLATRNVGALVVSTDGEKVEGIISERDIVRGINETGPEMLDHKVSELMTEKVITCVATDRIVGIMAIMIKRHLRHIPVLDDGKFVATLSIRNMLTLRLSEVESEADALREYIAGHA